MLVRQGPRWLVNDVAEILFGVALRERNRGELPTFKPMDSRSIDSDSFLSANIRTILEVSMLSLLFCLQVETYRRIRVCGLSSIC